MTGTPLPPIAINVSHLQPTEKLAYPLRSLAWPGPPILDACCVHADYGHLLLLTSDGALCGVNLDTGATARLCSVELPAVVNDDVNAHFGPQALRLHASSDGRHAAIVVDQGQKGIVVDTLSGAVTMQLDGGDYYQDTVPFSACFLLFEGKNVFVHRTDWNRLDVANPATGASLSDRHIATYTDTERPEHYLDYFHGKLLPSPDGSRLFDDGWVWHPVSIPRTWSAFNWLSSNPWESEDGSSVVGHGMRDHWTTPACWIDNQHLALWNLAGYDDGEEEHGKGLRILDAAMAKQGYEAPLSMEIDEHPVLDLFSDGKHLFVTAEVGTTIWNLDSRSQLTAMPGFTARLHDTQRGSLVAFEHGAIAEFSLSWLRPADLQIEQ